ncbi:protein kinase [Pendulispora brunnea]|uniref:Protein kinase n=1 Tax=Pendulispora brunnea TaxID=2905690 RepID=A0ABZ2K1W6_9BACT
MSRRDPLENKVVAGRFVIEEPAGSGGMGVVYRARDQQRDGARVALKVLHSTAYVQQFQERFEREAQVLSTLNHPGIVSYVDHGTTPQGESYLVMEWLEGEDLETRLEREGLTLGETLTLFRKIADALSAAHRHGIVHRDLKPGNIFLVGGRPDAVSLVDFGVARLVSSHLTTPGLAIGTPRYMAPEQARGEPDVGPSADVFTLGCVMFQCLTGESPFVGGHPAFVMANILLQEAPRLRTRRPAMPQSVEDLVARMLAKDPQHRPKDASALLQALDALGSLPDTAAPEPPPSVQRSAHPQLAVPLLDEQQLVSVIVSVSENRRESPRTAFADALRGRFGARVELLVDGSVVAVLAQTERMTATDQAVHAARCALVMRQEQPWRRVVVTTGRGVVGANHPSGEAIDRAGSLMQAFTETESASTRSGVLIDDVTARLLDARFLVSRTSSGHCVLEAEHHTDEARPLLGRPTPCVGRERELALLRMLLSECSDESVARLALIIAPPGTGKSRVRREFLRQVARDDATVETLVGHSDPTRAGAPYGLLWDALRRLADVHDGEELPLQQSKLRERVRRHVPSNEAQFVSEFLGELCGIPFPSEASPKLRDARNEPHMMAGLVNRAFVSFFRAESNAHPVLLVLEDLQWGDALTVRVVDAMLRECSDQRIMVLAFGRPEVNEIFPRLWPGRKRQDILLDGLTKKASTQLATGILGDEVALEVVERIVDQAAGNALFLEELIRSVAEESLEHSSMPATVLAMLQARLKRLEPDVRRLLRAASVFGATFWRGGVIALLEAQESASRVDEWLGVLVNQELVVHDTGGRFLGDVQYSFRHELVREGAHSMLTDADRVAGHRAAAAFLESMGERDPRVLAEHFVLGEQMTRATVCYARAAVNAFNQGDLAAVIELSERGIACGAEGELLGALLAGGARAQALKHCDHDKAYALLARAVPLLRRGSIEWWIAMGMITSIVGLVGRSDEFPRWADEFWAAPCDPDAAVIQVEAASYVVFYSIRAERGSLAEQYLARMDERIPAIRSVHAKGMWKLAHAQYEWYVQADPWAACTMAAEAEALFEASANPRLIAFARIYRGVSLVALGSLDAGEQKLRAAFAEADRSRDWLLSVVTPNLAMLLVDKGDGASIDEAERILRVHLDQQGDRSFQGLSNAILAEIFLIRGELASAEKHARLSIKMTDGYTLYRVYAHVVLTKILQCSGRFVEACHHIDAALSWYAKVGACFLDVRLWLAVFEAHAAANDQVATRALGVAVERIRTRAERMADTNLRTRFLTNNSVNRRVLEEARTHLPPSALAFAQTDGLAE